MNTKGNIFSDVVTAVKLTAEVRKARKAGTAVEVVRKAYTIPVLKTSCWVWTPESCLFYTEKWIPIKEAFKVLPEDVQHSLTFTPKDGGWPGRIQFWREQLRPVLPPKQYHEAIMILAAWGRRCVQRRREGKRTAISAASAALTPLLAETGK